MSKPLELSPSRIRQIAELALTLEPILDKQDCTTRYKDLQGKPLTDFLIAAVNVGAVIEDFARSATQGRVSVFSHFAQALQASNNFKSKKYINTGLLHFLFITIAVRLKSETLREALDNYIPVMQATTNDDVRDFIGGIAVGWSSSPLKREWINERRTLLPQVSSYYELQQTISSRTKDHATSSYQVTKQAVDGFPIIREYVESIDEQKGLIASLEEAYASIHQRYPQLKVGILADFSASALFLYLSYQNPDTYQIR